MVKEKNLKKIIQEAQEIGRRGSRLLFHSYINIKTNFTDFFKAQTRREGVRSINKITRKNFRLNLTKFISV